jgi:biotin carboxyl carrier protein
VLQGKILPGKAFFLTFVEACGIQLETDPLWEKAWNRVALQHQAHAPEVTVAQHYEQLGDLRRQLVETEQQARSAGNHELVRIQKAAAARLNLVIRRAEVAESLLQWERKQSRSRFASVCMPELDEGMTEGTVVRWFKKEGDLVEQDEPLVQITTPTRVADHACPIPGAVRVITVAADTTAAVGTVLAVIEHDPARDLVRVLLPHLGKSATDGVITRWLKKEGERVEQDESLLELATNLADIEVPSPAAGILRRIVAAEDETVAVGAELGVIDPRKQQLKPPSGSVGISMPQLGEKVTEGTVIRWLKKEGERVEQDEPLLEVSTDKVDTEIPSPVTGILRGIAVAEDETVVVGGQLGFIDTEAPG